MTMPAPRQPAAHPLSPPGRVAALLLVPGLMLAACSSAEDAETPAPQPSLTPNPVMTAAPDGSAITPGEWFIEEDGDGAQARFGTMGSEPRVTMNCDRATRTLTLAYAGDGEGQQTYILDAGGEQASLDMTPTDGEVPMLSAEINPMQPVFRGFSQLGSVIEMTAPDGRVTRMPAAPGISRVIEACS